MKKTYDIKKIIIELLVGITTIIAIPSFFFQLGIGYYINIWSYLVDAKNELCSKIEISTFFAMQLILLCTLYWLNRKNGKNTKIREYFFQICIDISAIIIGAIAIFQISNEILIVLMTITILCHMGIIIVYLIRLSIKIYKLNNINPEFYVYKVLYAHKLESLVAILVISSQIIIFIYSFIYLRINILIHSAGIDMEGLKQDGFLIKDFTSIYYFSSVTFFTVGYGDILPHGDKLKLLSISEMIIGFMVNLLYVPVLFTFIIDIFNKTTPKDIKSEYSSLEPIDMSEFCKISCFSFEDIKNNKHQNINYLESLEILEQCFECEDVKNNIEQKLNNLGRFELLEKSILKDINIEYSDCFYIDIVDNSLSMLNIYKGDKVLILKKVDLEPNELGMFFLDNNSKKIIFGSMHIHDIMIRNKIDWQPKKWVEVYRDNRIKPIDKVIPIGKVIYIKRK
jgi:voltage-gated potassium channel